MKSKSKFREFSTQSKSDLRHGLGISQKVKGSENELDEEFMRQSMKRFIAHQDVLQKIKTTKEKGSIPIGSKW